MKKLTTEEFINKAKAVHGDFYDYSLCEYVTNRVDVKIICPVHGVFMQSPTNHLSGKGCRACGGNRPYDTKSFIDAAKRVHGDEFDYSETEYVRYHDKVKIICKVHGMFFQAACDHLEGCGCPICSKIKGHALHRNHKEEVRKRQETMLSRYGVRHALQSERFKKKRNDSCIKSCGAAYPAQNKTIMKRTLDAKRENKSFATSKPEEILNKILIEKFGKDDILRQYTDERYPYQCDFYIKSLDLFIELNALWTHGFMWFDADDKKCVEKLKGWQEKAKTSKFYDNAITVWTEKDIEKREAARASGINYAVFWNNDLSDAREWIERGCPVRKDYLMVKDELRDLRKSLNMSQIEFGAYFKIPAINISRWEQGVSEPPLYVFDMMKRIISFEYPGIFDFDTQSDEDNKSVVNKIILYPGVRPEFTGKPANCIKLAKWYQFQVIYERELKMWRENPEYKGMRLRDWLFENRKKYLHKGQDELSDLEILRGFTISGIFHGYSSFDSTVMGQVIDEYDIKTVYDICAGWGERMLCAAAHGAQYVGADINGKLFDGYRRMISDLGLKNCLFEVADSSKLKIEQDSFDAVITCPPYWNQELYSKNGAENLSKTDFLDWWEREIKNIKDAEIKLLCFQINTVWRDTLIEIAAKNGYVTDKIIDLKLQSSHFTRKGGKNSKTSLEHMVVMRLS